MYIDKKIYQKEAIKIVQLAPKYNVSKNNCLLDIACGTAEPDSYLCDNIWYDEMIQIV